MATPTVNQALVVIAEMVAPAVVVSAAAAGEAVGVVLVTSLTCSATTVASMAIFRIIVPLTELMILQIDDT